MLERIRTRTGNSVIYRQGAVRKVLRELAAESWRGAADRSAPAHAGRGVRRLLPASRGDDVGAGGAGAAHRRAGRFRCSRCRCRAADIASSTNIPSIRRTPTRRTRFASSRSAAPTCSRCTCGGIRSCGCGCIGGGAIRTCGGDDLLMRDEPDAERMSDPPVVVVAPNWLGDAVMALPAIADVGAPFRAGAADRRRPPRASPICSAWSRASTASGTGVERRLVAPARAATRTRFACANRSGNRDSPAEFIRQRPGSSTRARVAGASGATRPICARRLLTRAVPPTKNPMHQGEYYQHLVRELGIATGPLEPVLSIPASRGQRGASAAGRSWLGRAAAR